MRFLVTETLEGRAEELKEYVLGVQVLGRPESFDPRIDPIARVEASRLRNKLEICYATSDDGFTVRIVLPRGTYVPQFQVRDPSAAGPNVGARKFGVAVLSSVALIAFVTGLVLMLFWRSRGPLSPTLRFSILPPKNSVIDSAAPSPDGTRVVIAASIHGLSHLYLRSLTA